MSFIKRCVPSSHVNVHVNAHVNAHVKTNIVVKKPNDITHLNEETRLKREEIMKHGNVMTCVYHWISQENPKLFSELDEYKKV